MGLTLVTPPSVWPVTLAEAKAQVRVTGDHENDLLNRLIRTATAHVERTLDLSLTTRTYRLTLDAFTDHIELRRGPVQSVDAVEYVDEDGAMQTVAPSSYTVDLASDHRWWIVRNSGASWPTTLAGINAVAITYTAGFTSAPDDIRHAILLLVGHYFANREAVNIGNITSELPLAVESLLHPHRMVMV